MSYTGLEDLNNTNIETILTFPLTGDFWFWGKILFALFWIIGLTLYFEEKQRLGRANFLSAFAVSSLAVIVLSFIGSLIGIVTSEILTLVFVIGGILIFVWFVRSRA